MLFSLDQMLLFIEIYINMLFPNFKFIFYQYCVFFFYQYLVLSHYFKVIKEFTFLTDLSMPIDNINWQAKWVLSLVQKTLFKTKIINRGMLQFLLQHTRYSLYLFLAFILIFIKATVV